MKHRNALSPVLRVARIVPNTRTNAKSLSSQYLDCEVGNVNCISTSKILKLTLAKSLTANVHKRSYRRPLRETFYLSSVSYQNSHHVSVKSCGNTTRNRLVSWKTNILRQVAPHKTASRLTAVFNTIQHEPAKPPPNPKIYAGRGCGCFVNMSEKN